MKIILRDERTQMFMTVNGEWVAESAEALELLNIEAAGKQALTHGACDVVVVLKYDEPPCELALNPVYCARV